MRRISLAIVIGVALLLATLPLWYRGPAGAMELRGVLKDVGSRTITVATESGDVAIELRGEYSGLKWHEVIGILRAYLGEEVLVRAEYRGRSLVALSLEFPRRGVKF